MNAMQNAFSTTSVAQAVVNALAVAGAIWICKTIVKAATKPETRAAARSFLARVIPTRRTLIILAALFGGNSVRRIVVVLGDAGGQISAAAMAEILIHVLFIVYWMIVMLVWIPAFYVMNRDLDRKQKRIDALEARVNASEKATP